MSLDFKTAFDPAHGQAVQVAPDILRITAPNASAFTFHGTNSYVVGTDTLAIIDPGPDMPRHLDALMAAIGGRPVSHIFVSHTHFDHSPLAATLKARTGAMVCAEGPHRAARALHLGEINPLDASADIDFAPDLALGDGQTVDGDGWAIETIHTPGHTANHCVFALHGTGIVFSADHVMAWATSIVAPPDGAMADYMASLDRMLERDDRLYLPGHGGRLEKPKPFLRGLKAHRKMRERAITERVRAGDRTIPDMVRAIYRDTDPRLHGAAALSVLAHLEDLVGKGTVVCEGEPSLSAVFRPA
ncbi:MAG: MBL fold metallo-hydrolase [Rhizobiaceae bacterium]